MSKITIRTLLVLDVASIQKEIEAQGLEFLNGDNNGITKIFFTKPDLTTGQKAVVQVLIDKIGTGSITP